MEKKAPQLLAEMPQDLTTRPLVREFILLTKGVVYNAGPTPFFVYCYDDHECLSSLTTIMQHSAAIYDRRFQ